MPANVFQNVNTYFQYIEPFPAISIFDVFGRLNVSDSSSKVTVSILNYNCSRKLAYLSGMTIIESFEGVATFDKLSVFCIPGGNVSLLFTLQPVGMSTDFSLTTTMNLSFRPCTGGEILNDNQCEEW